jgi:hypothetical protein
MAQTMKHIRTADFQKIFTIKCAKVSLKSREVPAQSRVHQRVLDRAQQAVSPEDFSEQIAQKLQ